MLCSNGRNTGSSSPDLTLPMSIGFMKSRRSQETVIGSLASLLKLLPPKFHRTPCLGSKTHSPCSKAPQVEIRKEMKASRRQNREPSA